MPELPRYNADAAARTPRPYQRECVEEALNSLGQRPTLLHIATGGGKTFVANNVVAECLEDGGYALWITKDWWLLRQAATDIAQRKRRMARRLRRLGGPNRELGHLPSFREDDRVAVLYTTLQTFKSKLDHQQLPAAPPKLIVWDECHWGYNAPSGKALMRWARACSIPVLGLTGTPRYPEDFNRACSHSFPDLVRDGFLANYRAFTCRTGVSWEPRRHGSSDFTNESLRALSEDPRRNDRIVNEYVDNASRYGKTIVFACNIDHAEGLAQELQAKGVAARAIHSQLPPACCEELIEQFAQPEPEIEVLVNVAKLTHGISIPDIQSVFLCRPTTSDILFSQMVGRGAHAYGRDTFNLVEFTDNLTRFAHVLHADEFFGSPAAGEAHRYASRSWHHTFDRGLEPAWTGDDVPNEVRGLWYRGGQTFGVEFELASTEWEPDAIPEDEYVRVAEGLLQHLRERLGDGRVRNSPCGAYHEDVDFSEWKVEPDSSVGWEVVSPVLKGKDGLVELHRACAALSAAVADRDLGLCINWRCGTHAHMGWDDENAARALQLAHLLEPILRSLVPPSRFAQYSPTDDSYRTDTPNEYCRPVSDVYDVESIDDDTSLGDVRSMARNDPQEWGGRTVGLNVRPLLDGLGHIEVRLLGGTTEARKLIPWLSLWMRILWRAERPLGDDLFDLAYDRESSVAFPDLDLEDLFRKEAIGVPADRPSLLKSLQTRQREIFQIWRAHPELAEWIPRHHHHWELNVEIMLRKMELPIPTHDFDELDEFAQKVAVWCTLAGEGGLPREDAIRLSAARLRDQEWVYFERLRKGGPVYKLISNALQHAKMPKSQGGDDWFDIPNYRQVRAFRRFDEMRDEDWRRCVVEAVKAEGGRADRSWVYYAALEVSRRRFGVDRQNLTGNVQAKIRSAINSCIGREHIRREGREELVLDQ